MTGECRRIRGVVGETCGIGGKNEGESEGESRQTGESQVTIEFGNETLWGLVRRRREVGGRESQDPTPPHPPPTPPPPTTREVQAVCLML